MRKYVLTVFEPDTDDSKGMFGIHCEVDGEPRDEGVVRTGLADALFWIETMERNRTYG